VAGLITCPACKKDVSEEAEKCPHCGHPLKKKEASGCLTFIGVVVFIGGFFYWPCFIIAILIFIWAAVDKD
jgi:hypothetical protein